MQTSGSWVGLHRTEIIFNPQNTLDLADTLNEVEKISLQDVARVAKNYFSSDKWFVSMCGDMKEEDFEIGY